MSGSCAAAREAGAGMLTTMTGPLAVLRRDADAVSATSMEPRQCLLLSRQYIPRKSFKGEDAVTPIWHSDGPVL